MPIPITQLLVAALLFQTDPRSEPTEAGARTAVRAVADVPLETYRLELLDLAHESAATYPHNPHVKNRARALESVALACFELAQPRRALRCIEDIGNWRRGTGYADFALYAIEHGAADEAREHLDRALEVSSTSEDVELQDWRGDRIQARVARAYALLGDLEQARRLEQGLEHAAAGETTLVRSAALEEQELGVHLAELDALVATGNFDLLSQALENYVELYRRFFADPEQRRAIDQRIEAACRKLPRNILVETHERLANVAADHGDREQTLELVLRIEDSLGTLEWRAEDHVALAARLVVLRLRAGDEARARAALETAVALYDARRGEIESADRAGALRPIAEAFRALGDAGKALEFYRHAVEEGAVNPNLMPRINDLVATCNSMAIHDVEPDAQLWSRLRAIQSELARRVAGSG
jgi:hypothetical protein